MDMQQTNNVLPDQFINRVASEVCFNRDGIDWKKTRKMFGTLPDRSDALERLYDRCMELNPYFDEKKLGHFLSNKLYVSVSVESLIGMKQKEWKNECERMFEQVKQEGVFRPEVYLYYLIRSGFTEEDVEVFRSEYLESNSRQLDSSVLGQMKDTFTKERVSEKKANIMLDSARWTLDILNEGRDGKHAFENVGDLKICKIDDTMSGSFYKDCLMDFGYRDCAYINSGESFIVVLNDGRIMSGSNVYRSDDIIDAVSEKYKEQGVNCGKWKDIIYSGLHKGITDAKGQYIGYLDSEMLNIGLEYDTITICTPDRFNDMLQHNENVAKTKREEIDRFMEQYLGLSDIIIADYGSVFCIPRIDKFFPSHSDNGCLEYGIHKCEVFGSEGYLTGKYFFYEEDGKCKSLLPVPVCSTSITNDDFFRRDYMGESMDFDDFTVVYKGVLSGQVKVTADSEAHFVVDMESKEASFFKDGKEYSKAAFCEEFLHKGKGNEIKR